MTIDLLSSIRAVADAYMLPFWDITPPFTELGAVDCGLQRILEPDYDFAEAGQKMIGTFKPPLFLTIESRFHFCYALTALPDSPDHVYLVGPWVIGKLSKEREHELCGEYGQSAAKEISKLHHTIHCYPNDEPSLMVSALIQLAYPEAVAGIDHVMVSPDYLWKKESHIGKADKVVITALQAGTERARLEVERKIASAAMRGDVKETLANCLAIDRFRLGRWTGDSSRDLKNHLHVYNTLLRVAVERNEVHPYYSAKLFDRYAKMIEHLQTGENLEVVLVPMVQDYCACVHSFSLNKYSPHIRKVINHINLNLSDSLTLTELARLCHVSPGHISNTFKRETGQSLVDYINERRVRTAAECLIYESEPIAKIAAQVGIMDANYFTRVFKKVMGVTPTEYREEKREKTV